MESPFVGDSEMARRMREVDWAATPLGPPQGWPAALRTAVGLMLHSQLPMYVAWGPEWRVLYNDAYAPLLGARHPDALGRPFETTWPEVWPGLRPAFAAALTGSSLYQEDLLMALERRGYPEEAYFTFSVSMIGDPDADAAGVFCACTETTGRVIGERRLRVLGDLGELGGAPGVESACTAAVEVLARHRADVPAALLYLLDEARTTARLVAVTGVDDGGALAPETVELPGEQDGAAFWAPVLREVTASGRTAVLGGLAAAVPGGRHGGPSFDTVVALPLTVGSARHPSGVLIVAASPNLPLDDEHRAFLELVGHHIATAATAAGAFAAQHRRAEELAELDRAKTAFFTGISHEFRTPLTLILGPVAELRDGAPAGSPLRSELDLVHRNGRRLGRLVNRLLELSRLQAGRVDTRFEPVDLAVLTADLAGVFRSAVQRAGLELRVDCPDLGEPVLVDRGMWEQVVLNLLSNALKFTFTGSIGVTLRLDAGSAVLEVSDTGTGIPAAEMPRLFERFHRIARAAARSAEGSGIGLALVQELVAQHGGTVSARSTPGAGTTVTVALPRGRAHLPADRISPAREPGLDQGASDETVAEALWWLHEPPSDAPPAAEPAPERGEATRILVADDNADMRGYLSRLLRGTHRVETVADGVAALAAARAEPPDLVLADVMMPGLDGLGLLAALRDDPRTAVVPVVLMSARAGAEAAVEGLAAGADDYLVKPFSARELRARVDGRVALGRARREAERRFRAMADSTPTLIWADGSGGHRLFVNRGWLEFTGAETDADLGLAWHDRIHPADRQLYAAVRAGAGGGPFEVEYRLRAADGRHRWVLDRGAPVEGGYVGGCLDIHTRVVERERQRLLAVVGAVLDQETTAEGRRTVLVRTIVDEGIADLARVVVLDDGGVADDRAFAARTPELTALLADLRADWAPARGAVTADGPPRRFEVDEEFLAMSTADEAQRELRRALGLRTIVLVPLSARGGVSGLLVAGRTVGSDPVDDEVLALLADLGERAGTALDNAELLDREQSTRSRLEQLQEATAALSAAATPEQVTAAAVDRFAALAGTRDVRLHRLTGSGADAVLEPLSPDGSPPVPVAGPSAPARAARDGVPVWADDGGHVDWIPLVAAEACVGVVGLGGCRRDVRTAGARAAVTVLAKLCAQALQRAGLLATERTARRTAEELGEVVGALSGATTPVEVAEVVLDHAVRLGATAASVLLRAGDHLAVVAARGDDTAGGGRDPRVVRLPVSAAHPAAFTARTGDAVWASPGAPVREGVPAHVTVPLLLGPGTGRPLGVIALQFDGVPPAFSDQERGAVLTLAGQCAQALDRARLHQAEHDVADVLQRSLLPRDLPPLPRLGLAARYLPSARGLAAGGDWYDVLPIDRHRVALVVGDVVGHGATAAAVMGQLRSALAAYLLDGHSPAAALERLDRFARRVPGATGSTCVCLVIDCATGAMRFARAGHPPVLVLDGAGPRYLDDGGGTVLGVIGRPPYVEAHAAIDPGSSVLLYTDGLVERRGEVIDEGQERLARAASAVRDRSPDDLVDALVGGALGAGVLGDPAQPDDVALVAVRLLPAPLRGRLPARPNQLRVMRRAVERWAAEVGLSDEVLDDLQYALGEAAANAVEHAYPPGADGAFQFALTHLPAGNGGPGGVGVAVRDAGRWRPVPADSGHRGRGVAVLHAVGEDVRIDHGGSGTTVTFRVPVPRAAPSAPSRRAAQAAARGAEGPVEVVADPAAAPPTVRVSGDLDLAGVATARPALLAALGPDELVVDLSGTGYVSSAGVSLLVELAARAQERGTRLVLRVADGTAAARVLDVSGLRATLPVVGPREDGPQEGGPQGAGPPAREGEPVSGRAG